jgi:hypothetical protein
LEHRQNSSIMSGRAGRNNSRGGRGSGGRSRGRGRGQNYSGTTSTTKKGLCDALGANVFDYGQKAAADQMRTSWEKITEYVGTTYGQDISNELQNKTTVTIAEPTHTLTVIARNATRLSEMVRITCNRPGESERSFWNKQFLTLWIQERLLI